MDLHQTIDRNCMYHRYKLKEKWEIPLKISYILIFDTTHMIPYESPLEK